MTRFLKFSLCAATALVFLIPSGGVAQADRLDPLYERLLEVDPADSKPLEEKIWQEWSKSGSPAMDLLLKRGQQAMEAERYAEAIDHFTALTDHAPDFAQGWHARATAYYQRKLYGPALADIQTALRLEPRHFGALSGLAVILEELDRPAQALEVYRAVEAIHPQRENLRAKIEQLQTMTEGRAL